MSSKLKSVLFYAFTFGAAAFLIWIVWKGIDPPEINGEKQGRGEFIISFLKEANIIYLALAAIAAFFSHLIRAERWRLLLTPLGYTVSLKESFVAVLNGYFINLIIPRGGEVSRCVALRKMSARVPVQTSLGTIVAERIIDLIFLVVCVGSVFLIEFDKLTSFFSDYTKEAGQGTKDDTGFPWLWIIAGAGALIFICAFVFIRLKKELYEKVKTKAQSVIKGLKEGLLSVFKLKKRGLFIVYSLAIWFCYYLTFYFILSAFPLAAELGPLAALTIFTIGSMGMAIPMPGGAGSFHLLVSTGLVALYGVHESGAMSQYVTDQIAANPSLTAADFINKNTAGAFTLILHAFQTILLIILGVIAMGVSEKLIKKANAEQGAAEQK